MTVLVGILALAAASVPQSDDSAAARVRDRDPVEHVDPDLRGRTCGSISVSSPGQPRVRERFSARMTLDLMFRMAFSSRDEDAHLVTFRIFTPNGHLYQEVQVVPRKGSARASSISTRLPVAGTVIATSSLFGRWRVVPYFDVNPRPCASAAVFTVVP